MTISEQMTPDRAGLLHLLELTERAVKEEDPSLMSLPVYWDWMETLPKGVSLEDLAGDDYMRLADAVIALDNLHRRGPLVDDPDQYIESIHQALDRKDADKARELLGVLQGSWCSGGPRLSKEGIRRLGEALSRREWDLY